MLKLLFYSLALLTLYTYLFYTVILIAIHRIRKRSLKKDPAYTPTVTMLIAAHNEAAVIKEKLDNCLALDYPHERFSVLIGSDGSDDDTVDLINRYKQGRVQVFDYAERQGKLAVLKKLVRLTDADILVFSDANTMYEPNALRALVRHFADERVGCVCGRLILKSPGSREGEYEGVYWRYESFIKQLEGELGVCLGANGGIYALRKKLFPSIPNDTIVEDFVIPMKVLERGYAVIYDKQALAHEESSQTIADEGKRKVRIGAGAYQALVYLLPMLSPTKGVAAFAYWSHKVLRWLVPFFLPALLVLNLFLMKSVWCQWAFLGQMGLYVCAMVGWVLSRPQTTDQRPKSNGEGTMGERNAGALKVFEMCYYFVAMNAALLRGFFRYLAGSQKVTWERVER